MYRIYTEDTGGNTAALVVAAYFDSFTMYRATGYWRGMSERALVFDIETDLSPRVVECAKRLKVELKQEGVLLAAIDSESWVI